MMVRVASTGAVVVVVGRVVVVLVAWTALGRIGLGFVLASLNLGAMRPLDRTLIAQGASAINFLRTLGGAAGVSLCAVMLEWRLAAHGDTLTRAEASPPPVICQKLTDRHSRLRPFYLTGGPPKCAFQES